MTDHDKLVFQHRLGENILAHRKVAQTTQKEVAAALEICAAKYAYIEHGKTMPNALELARLAKLFGVKADELLKFN